MNMLRDFPDFLQMLALVFEQMFDGADSPASFTFSGKFLADEAFSGISRQSWATWLGDRETAEGDACTCGISLRLETEQSPPLFVPNEALYFNARPASFMLHSDEEGRLEYLEVFFDDEKGFRFLADVIEAFPTAECASRWDDAVRTVEDFERVMSVKSLAVIEV